MTNDAKQKNKEIPKDPFPQFLECNLKIERLNDGPIYEVRAYTQIDDIEFMGRGQAIGPTDAATIAMSNLDRYMFRYLLDAEEKSDEN